MKQTHLITMVLIILGLLISFTPAQARWAQQDENTFLFYPDDIVYVDRNLPQTYLGGESRVIVRDWFGNPVLDPGPGYPDTTSYYDEVDAARTYMKFNTDDLTTVLNGYTVDSATLVMYLNGITDGNAGKAENINVRQVTSATSLDYIQGLKWDWQPPPIPQNNNQGRDVQIGEIFATQDFGASEAMGAKYWTQSSTHTLGQLVGVWKSGSVANYGIVLENEYDGGWHEEEDGKLYSVNNPAEMDELEAIFAKGDSYPYLRVSATKVVPEPASMVLALVGAGVLKLASRRKKK